MSLKKSLILIFIISLFICNKAFAINLNSSSKPLIRVGISDNSFKKLFYNDITIGATSEYKVYNSETKKVISNLGATDLLTIKYQNRKYKLYKNSEPLEGEYQSRIKIEPISRNGLLKISGLKRKGKEALYKGIFEIIPSNDVKKDEFAIVNILNIQDYLKAVVPNEMPVRFGKEALKAQSIAARNYVLKPRVKYYTQFDVCDSTSSQVYFGANTQNTLSDAAVDETESIVALYNDELILALYCSTNGGYSESYHNAFSQDKPVFLFPSIPIPYLKAVSDNPYVPKLDYEGYAKWFYTNAPESFDVNSPLYRWERSWNIVELEDILRKRIKTVFNTKFISPIIEDENFDYGKLKNINVLKRGESGKIIELEVEFENVKFKIKKELIIRKVFINNNKMLPSANLIFEMERDEKGNLKQVRAIGGGFGHGVGMSQYGAGFMAQHNYLFDKILKHYYTGITLGTYPIEIDNSLNHLNSTEDGKIYSQRFYSGAKKGILHIIGSMNFLKIEINLNGHIEVYNLTPLDIKFRDDISRYLKSGENNVSYKIIGDNKNKKVKIYIELDEFN